MVSRNPILIGGFELDELGLWLLPARATSATQP
jgi:hypothetical protein